MAKEKDNLNLKLFIIYFALFIIFIFVTLIYLKLVNFNPIIYPIPPVYEDMTSQDLGIEKHSVSGVTIPGCGYFVDVRGRNFEQINNTDYHEACHILVKEDYYHFCEQYYNKKQTEEDKEDK